MTDDQLPAAARPGPEGSTQSEPPAPDEAAAPPPTPALVATGLGLMGGAGWVFREVSLTVPAGALAAVVGPAGSGRSSLLLTLAGRMAPTEGLLSVLGHDLAADAAAVRGLTSVARAGGVIGPEPALTVHESIDERCLIDDVPAAEGHTRFDQACAAMQFTPDPTEPVEGVTGERAALLAVALAFVRTSAVIVLDDLDRDIAVAGRGALAQALRRVADLGPALVVAATDSSAVPDADVVVDLALPAGRTPWSFDPASGNGSAR